MDLLHGRFEIVAAIGRGAQAATFRAKDHLTGDEVALKELDFRRVEDWKAQELFEREGATLRALEHPAIPRYVDAFAVEDEKSVRLFLAQEFVEGRTLADELASGRRWTEGELIADARQILDALSYLHQRSPPVIHRDVKPSNIIRRPDGRLALVDFGAVQNVLPETVGGSTVIGTPGYMPMEQLMGRAVPATDLYALGATLIHLLSAVAPADLPLERNRLRFDDRVQCTSSLMAVLRKLTDPLVEERFAQAGDVLKELTSAFDADTLPTRLDMPRRVDEPVDVALFDADTVDPVPGPYEPMSRADRLSDTPGWAAPREENGALVVAFDTKDSGNFALDIQISDRPDAVDVRARSPRRGGSRKTASRFMLAMGIVAMFMSANALPVALAALVAVTLVVLAESTAPPVAVDVHVDERGVRITKDYMVVYSGPLGGTWRATRDGKLQFDRWDEVVLQLSTDSEYYAEWLAAYLNARTHELEPATLAREEFWKEEPAEVSAG